MDLETAIEIVKDYGRILEEDPIKNIQGRPESVLPYDKDKIKEAIKVNLTFVGTAVPKDERLFRTLQIGFIQLASFIPDAEVTHFNVNDALNAKDVRQKYYQYLTECEKTNKYIMEQTVVPQEKIDVFCQKNSL